ncbi:Diacylglycerol kinase family enzyme [Deinococcus reticulitermitis]|uniref:Diacylglycerol kinase family enzyme n=1 Tax=Deinococcus reticulitermitis TaxID=856736 RepID=A0A1H6T0Q9_9DEIO|nr:diacylglycerol kinase family protein [Deinococcus reticulitermitis]SEI73651.1 Diacylglycerol kinase family enzyme [Deinococcus reticulitermitis]
MTAASFPASSRAFTVVLNAQAGRGLAGREWPRLEAELRARVIDFEVIRAASGEEALARVQALAPERAVLTVGGDGTVGALLPALVGTGRPVALVPLGSGNDFAGMLGLRAGDFAEALDRLSYAPRQIDAMQVEIVRGDHAGLRRLLLNGLGTGFDAQVTHAYLRAPGALPGFWRYAWGALGSVRDLRLAGLRMVADGAVIYEGPSCLAAVMNGTRYGGGFRISPASDARDGLLNAVCSGPLSRMQLLGLMARVLRGTHLGHPRVHAGAGQRVELHWSAPVHLHLDGDLWGRAQEVRAEVLPGAVELLNG